MNFPFNGMTGMQVSSRFIRYGKIVRVPDARVRRFYSRRTNPNRSNIFPEDIHWPVFNRWAIMHYRSPGVMVIPLEFTPGRYWEISANAKTASIGPSMIYQSHKILLSPSLWSFLCPSWTLILHSGVFGYKVSNFERNYSQRRRLSRWIRSAFFLFITKIQTQVTGSVYNSGVGNSCEGGISGVVNGVTKAIGLYSKNPENCSLPFTGSWWQTLAK